MESAQLHRRELKRRLSVSSIAVASVVKGCLERALVAADTVIAILEENERDKANSFGVEFSPSATIGACIAARRILVGQLEQVTRNPELISPESVARLLGINIAA